MHFSLNTIFGWIVMYRYGILLPIAIIEGPIISVIAGFLVSIGQMNFWIAYGLLVLGDVIGDISIYCLGRFGGLKLVERYGHFLKITPEKIKKLESFFHRHAKKTILFGKWGHALGFPILMTAGIAKMPAREFVGMSVASTLPKTLLLVIIGIYFGASYGLISHYLDYFVFGSLIVIALFGFGYWAFRKTTEKYFAGVE